MHKKNDLFPTEIFGAHRNQKTMNHIYPHENEEKKLFEKFTKK